MRPKRILLLSFLLISTFCQGQGLKQVFQSMKRLTGGGEQKVKTEEKVIDKSFSSAINPFEEPTFTYGPNDLVPTKDGSVFGYKQFGNWVIKPRFEKAGPFIEGLASVCLFGKYGYINRNDEVVIPFKFDAAQSFYEGLAAVMLNGKWGFINTSGKVVIAYRYDQAGSFKDGLACVSNNKTTGYIDKDGIWYQNPSDRMESYRGFAKHFVEKMVNDWQRKGKYEKTEEWRKRVNDQSRQMMIDSLLKEAQEEYIATQGSKITTIVTLADYDADGEIFLINDSKFGNLLVPVPIQDAEYFETHFDQVKRENKYCIKNDGIGLAESRFELNGKTYRYSNQASLQFENIDIDYNFEKIDFDGNLLASNSVAEGNQSIKSRSAVSSLKSDIDLNIPISEINNSNTFAVIIANENYRREVPVEFALNDGSAFKDYCSKTLGIPDKNIRFIKDATLVDMWDQIDWLQSVERSYQGDAKVILYYAGHGIPDESSRDAYLLPVDGKGSNVSTGYKLSDLYDKLAQYPTQSTVVLLDACFSGAQRDGSMLASARGVAIKAKAAQPKGNMVVFSAAQGDETAYPYREKGHGMFTCFLLKKLQETGGNATLGEIATFVNMEVGKMSIIENSKSQTPTVTPSTDAFDNWRNLMLK